ncbi:MAG: hypothetical protein ACK559_31925, partial [bacterium]
DSVAHGHDCKHQLNVCEFLLVLDAQILDTAFSAGVEKCKSKTFSILSISGFAHRSTLRFITISSFIQCYLFYVSLV